MKGKKYGLQPVKKKPFENMQEKQMLADQIEYDKQQMARLLAEQRAEDAQKRAQRAREAQLDAESRERDELCEKNALKRNLDDLQVAVVAKGLKPDQLVIEHKRKQQAEIFKKREEERQLRERIKQQAAEKDTQQAQSRERRGPGLSR